MILKSLVLIAVFLVTPEEQIVRDIAVVPRRTGSAQLVKVRKYIVKNLESCNLEPKIQKFGGGTGENITALKDCIGTNKAIVVGGHYDSVASSPGADDNASGTAVVMEIARRLKTKKLKYDVLFVLFSGEEQGLVGSRYWVRNHPRSKDIEFMINADMVGHLKSSDRKAPEDISEILKKLYKTYPFASNITYRGGGSDQASFSCPTIFLHTGLHRHYHRPSDLPDTLNFVGLNKIVDYCEALVLEIAEDDGTIKPDVDYDDLIWGLQIMPRNH